MATHRTAPREPAPRQPLPAGLVLRLHTTTALSRLMRDDPAGAAEALAVLSAADLAQAARAVEQLAATVRLARGEAESGAA